MSITYQELQTEAVEIERKLNDLRTAVYVIKPFEDKEFYHPEFKTPLYYFISYYDLDKNDMRFTITDIHMNELQALVEIPSEVLIGYCLFMETIKKWQADRTTPFPFHAFSGKLPEEYASTVRQKMQDELKHNGDEAKLI
jgi:hypothetical protein